VGTVRCPRVLGWAPVPRGRPGEAGWSGRVGVGSGWVQVLQAVPGGGQVG
jgi:hypothetical protein